MREVRAETFRLDAEGSRAEGYAEQAAELERCAEEYAAAAERFAGLEHGLLGALAPYAAWTSAATHAVLPMLATEAGVRLQLRSGIDAHRRRFGHWDGGFWLPECAYAAWLGPLLEEAGVHASCVELTDALGHGAAGHLGPLRSGDGPLLMPIDRATMDLVWSDRGYPAAPAYRDSHRLTVHHHHVWANDGSPYDHARARGQARADARAFVATTRERLEGASSELGQPGLAVCALDTELLGHWWYEGVWWLDEVVAQAAEQDLALVGLDAALAELPARGELPPGLGITSWGTGRDLRTWSGPHVASIAWTARAAELRVVDAGAAASARAVRELLALQSSDWAFIVDRDLAAPYAQERVGLHAGAVERALAAGEDPELRSLAPDLALGALREP
jgi:1,4-alpha-glucan branching enzyme